MPSSRIQPSSPQTTKSTIYIRARVYSTTKTCPLWKTVPTQVSPKRQQKIRRYPWVEGLFTHRYIQPHIHDAKITVRQNGKKHDFVVFCQNHCHLPLNSAVTGQWRGDIVVMKMGTERSEYINMACHDARKIDQAINSFVAQVRQTTPFRFPKNLVLDL